MNSKETYSARLKDPRWQKLRLRKLEASEWKCEICGDGEESLNVHHVRYVSGWAPWDYPASDLQTLCETCHGLTHLDQRKVLAFCSDRVNKKPQPRAASNYEEFAEISGLAYFEKNQSEISREQMTELILAVQQAAIDYRNLVIGLQTKKREMDSKIFQSRLETQGNS